MDIARMRRASQALVGKHDFRNFSRLDPANMTVPVRELSGFRIERVPDEHDAAMWRLHAARDAADTAAMRSTALSSRAAAAAAAAAASSAAHINASASESASGSASASFSASASAGASSGLMESSGSASSMAVPDNRMDAESIASSLSAHSAADIDTDSDASALPTSVDTMFVMTISGTAFLWHQVRCMVAVLFMVGRGDEDADVCARMLDVERMPRKPVYQMASKLPLVLYQCGFEPEIEWRRNHCHSSGTQSDETFANVFRGFHNAHRRHAIGAAINRMFSAATARIAGAALPASSLPVPLSSALSASSASKQQSSAAHASPPLLLAPAPQLAGARHPRHAAHIPLARRETEMTIDERVAKLSAPKRERFEERRNKTTAVAAAVAVVCAVATTATTAGASDGVGGGGGSAGL
jgi:hypothetical protein